MVEHTRGPWEVSKYSDTTILEYGSGQEYWIANVGGESEAKAQANARMIATLPDMESALELVIEWGHHTDCLGARLDAKPSDCACPYRIAMKVLAKARGGTPV